MIFLLEFVPTASEYAPITLLCFAHCLIFWVFLAVTSPSVALRCASAAERRHSAASSARVVLVRDSGALRDHGHSCSAVTAYRVQRQSPVQGPGELRWLSLGRGRLRGSTVRVAPWRGEPGPVFSTVPTDRAGGSGHKLRLGKLHLSTRKRFLTARVVKHGCRLLMAAVDLHPGRWHGPAAWRRWCCLGCAGGCGVPPPQPRSAPPVRPRVPAPACPPEAG